MKRIVCIIILVLLFQRLIWGLSKEELGHKWIMANQAFQKAKTKEDFLKVAACYEEIVRSGVLNGYLFYNLGNSYFKGGRIDYAILNYRRADLYIPDSPELANNIKNARTIRGNPFKTSEESKIYRYLFFWHYIFSKQLRIYLSLLFYVVFWTLLTMKLFRVSLPYGLSLGIILILWILFTASVAIEEIEIRKFPPAVTLDGAIEVRKGNGEQYEILYDKPIQAGTEVKIVEERQSWVQIELPDQKRGWIPSDKVKPVISWE